MSMMYDPNNPNGVPNPAATGVNAPGGMNAQQGFLGGLRNAAMGLGQQALFGSQPNIAPGGQPTGQTFNGQQLLSQPSVQGTMPGSPMQALMGQGGGLLGNLSKGLQNNAVLAPAFKFGKQLASYF